MPTMAIGIGASDSMLRFVKKSGKEWYLRGETEISLNNYKIVSTVGTGGYVYAGGRADEPELLPTQGSTISKISPSDMLG